MLTAAHYGDPQHRKVTAQAHVVACFTRPPSYRPGPAPTSKILPCPPAFDPPPSCDPCAASLQRVFLLAAKCGHPLPQPPEPGYQEPQARAPYPKP